MRLRRRKRRRVPGINTASIADISFTLLILFLVVTSMDDDKGLTRMLPPLSPENQEAVELKERDVLRIDIAKGDVVYVNDEKTPIGKLLGRVKQFVDNPQDLPNLPEKHQKDIDLLGACGVTENHVIRIKSDGEANYGTYFKVQNEIVEAYRQLRDSLALTRFDRHYTQCTERQRDAIRTYYPQKVSEDYSKEGGAP